MSDFELLNNAIVRASMRRGAWGVLASDWQDQAVDERDWKMAIPPLWSGLMERFWVKYGQLYRVESNRAGLSNPYDIAPSGISGALRDLWAPTVDTGQKLQASAVAKLQAAQQAVETKIKNALLASGRSLAKGAAEETQKQTYEWAWSLGGLALGGLLVWRYFRPTARRSRGLGGVRKPKRQESSLSCGR